jgi:serine/threonine-protein kinase
MPAIYSKAAVGSTIEPMANPRAAPAVPPPPPPRKDKPGRIAAGEASGAPISDEQPPTRPGSGLNTLSVGHFPKWCPKCSGRYPADFRVCPRDATPLEDAPEGEDPLLGQVLADSYEVTRVLGEGGMGKVYEARHQRLHNKRYAVKMLHEELARQPDVVTRFQREAEAASALEHPNVVGVFDVNRTADGRPYIVAELLEGEQLGDYLDRVGKVSAEIAAQLVRPVCRALAVAHERGIVHRDIKPENIFLVGTPASMTVKVLDFGISKVGETSGTLTKTGMVMGTPGYIAPEQARGDKVDYRADIYALGAILYRAVTGQRPFEDLDPMAAITAVLVEETPRPSSIEPSVPPAFELVIQRAMARNPNERFASMVELDAALAPFEPIDGGVSLIAGVHPDKPVTTGVATEKTMLNVRTAGTQDTLAIVTRNVKLARPTIVFFTLTGLIWAVAILVDAVSGAIRWLGGGQNDLTPTEVNLTLIGAMFGVLTPAVVWMHYVKKSVWKNTPRAIAMALRLRRTVLFSAASYGAASLAVHLLQTLVQRHALGVAWPGWNVVLFFVAVVVATLTWVTTSIGAKS